MLEEIRLISALLMLGGAFVLLPVGWGAYHSYARRKRLVCPETRDKTAVKIDAWRAARTSLVGEPKLSVRDCTRWPARRYCRQECLAEAR